MAQKISRKELKHDEFVEAGLDVGQWLEEHWRAVALGAGGFFAVVLLFLGWNWWSENRMERASTLLAEGLALLEPAGVEGNQVGDPQAAATKFDEASRTAGASALGDVARTYQGIALLRAERETEAVPVLETVVHSAGDSVLLGTARALLADALSSAGNHDRAAEVYRALADVPTASFPAELALVRLGETRASQGRTDDARQAWQEVLSRFPESPYAGQARQLLARAESQ